MAAKPVSLQDQFLNAARKTRTPLTVFLLKGVKLQGAITWFDTFSVMLKREGQTLLVYKHSISTIMPAKPVQLAVESDPNAVPKAGLQDAFLSAAGRERQRMTVFLVNGVMLQGSVAAHDQFSLLLERSGQAQLVYKHAISTMQPEEPLSLDGFDADEHDGQ
jgi:host factor-I protein